MNLSFRGLTLAPSQVCGAVRLVPVLRHHPRADLRLWSKRQDAVVTGLALGGNLYYYNYIPSALVLDWTDDGRPVVTPGSQLLGPRDRPQFIKFEQKLVKRTAPRKLGEGERALRFFPQQLALEGLLAHHFGGPDIAWPAWSAQILRRGLSPRSESFVSGPAIRGLDEALRTFELHPDQVGVLVFVAEIFGAAFIMPSAAEYRPLHRSLLSDAFGEALADAARWHPIAYPWSLPTERPPRDLVDLKAQISQVRTGWAEFQTLVTADLLGEDLRWTQVYRAGPFSLARFLPSFEPGTRAHVGEAILDDEGEVQYLRTVLLGDDMRERAWWLDRLAGVGWHLPTLAERLRLTEDQLKRKLVRAGWEALLREKPQGSSS